ncbi:hypothetical protein [Streptomyces xantholiticus]|uniref:Uncharacterized protein n=1 Tax=Streptomyces xantholiticus TaxID=68285 RepID=A0ABV1V4M7_9ACTN
MAQLRSARVGGAAALAFRPGLRSTTLDDGQGVAGCSHILQICTIGGVAAFPTLGGDNASK